MSAVLTLLTIVGLIGLAFIGYSIWTYFTYYRPRKEWLNTLDHLMDRTVAAQTTAEMEAIRPDYAVWSLEAPDDFDNLRKTFRDYWDTKYMHLGTEGL